LDEAKPFSIVIGVQPKSTCAANWFGQKSAFLIEADCINRQSGSLCEFADLHGRLHEQGYTLEHSPESSGSENEEEKLYRVQEKLIARLQLSATAS